MGGKQDEQPFYLREYGLQPVVNCMGTMTSLGGSRMSPAALRAMTSAADAFVDLNALLRAAGRRVCGIAKAPEGYDAHLSTGAAACISLATAACMTLHDPQAAALLPDRASELPRNVVLLDAGSDLRWVRCVTLTGAEVRLLGDERAGRHWTADEVRAALRSPRVAAVLYFAAGDDDATRGGVALTELLALSKAAYVPLLVDAAAQLPPASNLWRYTRDLGVDGVIFSGGKAIAGPQTSGLLIGRRDIVEAARANGSPNEPTVGRTMKCSKEDICGFVAALEEFAGGSSGHHEGMVEWLRQALEGKPGIHPRRVCPGPPDIQPNHIPRLYIDVAVPREAVADGGTGSFDDGAGQDHGNPLAVVGRSAGAQLARRLAAGEPCIAVNTHPSGIVLNPQTMSQADAELVVRRIIEEVHDLCADGVIAAGPITSRL